MNQRQTILKYLQKGKKLTSLQALNKFGCFRLASRISELKQMGYPIRKEMVKKNNKSWAKYWIEA